MTNTTTATTSTPQAQPALFALSQPPEKSEPAPLPSPAARPVDAPPKPQPASDPDPHVSIEEFFEHIFRNLCHEHRYRRELLLGADDTELGKSLGHCVCFGEKAKIHFTADAGEPTLRIIDNTFGTIIATLTSPEIAVYVRRIMAIPERKPEDERKQLIENVLEGLRVSLRQGEMLPYIRSLAKEKRPRKPKKSEPTPPPSISDQIATLLFSPDCLTPVCDQRLLIQITRLLIRQAMIEPLLAAEHAISIIKRARREWESATWLWIDPEQAARYQQPKEADQETPA